MESTLELKFIAPVGWQISNKQNKKDMNKEMIYFKEGDEVTLKQENVAAPVMCVKEVKKGRIPEAYSNKIGDSKPRLKGILCFWFTVHGLYQEQVFSTKDLVKVE